MFGTPMATKLVTMRVRMANPVGSKYPRLKPARNATGVQSSNVRMELPEKINKECKAFYTLLTFAGRGPLCGTGVASFMEMILNP